MARIKTSIMNLFTGIFLTGLACYCWGYFKGYESGRTYQPKPRRKLSRHHFKINKSQLN